MARSFCSPSLWTVVCTGSAWTLLTRMHKCIDRKAGISRPPSSLGPPPLFRSIGLPALSASLPPHRRLRSIFCRSRSVLPASTHSTEASDPHTFTDIQAGNHARTILCPLGCNDELSQEIQSSTVLNALQPEADSHQRRGAVLRSGFFDTQSRAPASPQAQRRQQDGQLFSHLCPPARPSGRNRGRQGRLVTPLQTSEDPAIKEKQQQKRRKRSYKVDCAGKQKYATPSLNEKDEDARLCEWLQSLGIAESHGKDPVTTNNQQRLFVSRCRGVMGLREQHTAASHRRDRRPHFLPPISQPDSLLHVPFLLPENSPPPSTRSFPDAPVHSLPVPLLQPFSSRRKWDAVGQPKQGDPWLPEGLQALVVSRSAFQMSISIRSHWLISLNILKQYGYTKDLWRLFETLLDCSLILTCNLTFNEINQEVDTVRQTLVHSDEIQQTTTATNWPLCKLEGLVE